MTTDVFFFFLTAAAVRLKSPTKNYRDEPTLREPHKHTHTHTHTLLFYHYKDEMTMFGQKATLQRSFTPPPFVVFKNNDDNRKQMKRTAKTLIESRIRPGRQVEQRKFRMEREKESIGIYEYLETIGVAKSAALRVMSQATMQFEAERAKMGMTLDGSVKFDENEVRKVVEFLQSRDIREQQLGGLITNFPSVLAYDVETRLEPLFVYVEKELGITGTDFAKEVQRRPSLLGLRADENLAKMVGYLESTGSTREEVVEYLMKTL